MEIRIQMTNGEGEMIMSMVMSEKATIRLLMFKVIPALRDFPEEEVTAQTMEDMQKLRDGGTVKYYNPNTTATVELTKENT